MVKLTKWKRLRRRKERLRAEKTLTSKDEEKEVKLTEPENISENIQQSQEIEKLENTETDPGWDIKTPSLELKTILTQIPRYVYLAAIFALLENVQREDLNPIEEAQGLDKLIKKFKFTQDALAKKTGKSRSHIANLIRLLSLDKYVVRLLSDGKIDMGHARALVSLNASSQKVYADKIVLQKLSVREIEKMISEKSSIISKKTKKSRKDPHIRDIEDKLKEKLGVAVNIAYSAKKKSGKITLNYSSLEVLDGLLKKLGYK